MKPPIHLFSAGILVALLAGCASSPKFSDESFAQVQNQIRLSGAAQLQAGTAKVEITPAVGTPLAGYSKRKGRPSVGIRDPLFVRVLSLWDGEDQVLFIASDLLVFSDPLAEKIIRKLVFEFKIPRAGIVLATTHTHSGSGGIGHGWLHEKVFGRYDPQVVEGILARVTWAVRQALEAQEPVRWGAGISEKALVGLTENRMIPEGPVDPALSVLLIESLEGTPKAIVVNAAAHPTLMDSQDMRFSADYPGVLSQSVESLYPGAVCLFFNGAAGDLRPQDVLGENPEERVERFGKGLAEAATGLVNQLEVRKKADLAVWGQSQRLPPFQGKLGPVRIPSAIGQVIRPTQTHLNLVAIDQFLFVPLSAELSTALGSRLKRQLEQLDVQPILLGYANGYLGYAVTSSQHQSGSYEASMSWYGPGFGAFLIQRFRALARLYAQGRSS